MRHDPDTTMLIRELVTLSTRSRAAIIARLPEHQRPQIERAVALLESGGSVDVMERFSSRVAARLRDLTQGQGEDSGTEVLTPATRAALLKALSQIKANMPTDATARRRGHTNPSLASGLVAFARARVPK